MRGRTLFAYSQPLLHAGAAALRLAPASACELALTLLRHAPTRAGIALRYMLLRRLARRCGACVAVFEGVYLKSVRNLELGDHVSIHPMCYLDAAGGLTIGSDVSIAHASTIMTTEHDFAALGVATRDAPVRSAKVTVGDDVWIGCGVRILAGVAIGDRTVVGAGAVVTRDVPPDTLAVGAPARPQKGIKYAA